LSDPDDGGKMIPGMSAILTDFTCVTAQEYFINFSYHERFIAFLEARDHHKVNVAGIHKKQRKNIN
jgi:hypothetical protein